MVQTNFHINKNRNNLNLGWCIGYMGILYHMYDAIKEHNRLGVAARWDPPYAIFATIPSS